MNKIADNFNYFTTEHPDIYRAYCDYGKAIHDLGGPLDDKTRALIKLVVSSAAGYPFALETHIKKAAQAGCTRAEIEHAILLTAPTVGFPSMMESIMVLRRALDCMAGE